MNRLSRRHLLKLATVTGTTAFFSLVRADGPARATNPAPQASGARALPGMATPLMKDPVWVYDNWSAYAEGMSPQFEDTPLTEALAMRELQQLIRMKALGVHFDYYMMNAFWFSPQGAYREWRTPHWPEGPRRWIAACHENGLKPGLWFGTNSLWQIEAAPQWRDSLALEKHPDWHFESMCMYEGGFLSDFMRALHYWYEQGIRMFELDVANFDAATPAARQRDSLDEIRRKNKAALSTALKSFRRQHPEVMLVAFNDFGGDYKSTSSPFPFKKPVDLNWLEVFDTLYSGDIRVSDVPQASFWRSVDLYNDHMVRRYEQGGVPLERIDPFCTFSSTWFGYHRGKQAWKGMLLLTLARGSWKKTIYGSLGLLTDEEARWFATAQRMYEPLNALGRTKSFGSIPGEAQPYGFGSFDIGGALYTVVNPSQQVCSVELPRLSSVQGVLAGGRVLFRDAGFEPALNADGIVLGPGQMALVGFGRYASDEYDLGIQDDVVIPKHIAPIEARFRHSRPGTIEASLRAPQRGDLRLLFQHRTPDGAVLKTKAGGRIEVRQQGRLIPVISDRVDTAKGFGGTSWSVGEIRRSSLVGGKSISVSYSIDTPAMLEGRVYTVEY
jgi:hypothetical protein